MPTPSRLHAAIAWLDAHVPHDAEVEAGIMRRLAGQDGHRESTLKLARYHLGVESWKSQGCVNGPWLWGRTSDATSSGYGTSPL